jgi:KilA-N domain
MNSLYTDIAMMLTNALRGTDNEYVFSGIPVRVRGIDGYVNISAIAIAANKDVAQYFRTKRAINFLATLKQELQMNENIESLELLKKIATNHGHETWAHPIVLLDFSTWIPGLFGTQISVWFIELRVGKQRVNELMANI